MSNSRNKQQLHHIPPTSLSKDDNLHSSCTSFLDHTNARSFLSDDHCPPPPSRRGDNTHNEDSSDQDADDVFSIPQKHPPSPSYQRWKKATLALNASRRFRYTADFEQHERRIRRLRATTHAVRAAHRFQQLIIHDDCRSTDAPFQGHSLDKTIASSQQYGDSLKMELTSMSRESYPSVHSTATALNGHVSSMRQETLQDKLAASLQDRNEHLLEELGGVGGVAAALETSLENGLPSDPQYIQKRRDDFGSNTYPQQPPKPFYCFVLDACKDPTLIILMFCAMLSLGFGIKSHGIKEGWYDGASIAFAVILVVLVTSVSDYRQSLQFLNLSKEKRNIVVHVIRGGRKMQVSIFDLVLGDLVTLSIGDQVPADGLFVGGHSLVLNESSMTGESEPVHVDSKMPFLLSGCKVADGYGTMLVTGVGMSTEWGRLMAELGDDIGEETPLQVRLNGVATFVGQVGLSVALLVLLILLIFYFTGHKEGANNSGKYRAHHTSSSTIINSIVDILAIAITIVVVAVPEGLPLAVTLSLAYAMKKMMADRALVRRLAACETMGSATAICTDKTGTLTLNVMTVVKVWLADEYRDADRLPSISKGFESFLLEAIAQNSSASVFVPPEGGEPEVMGSPTEKAVLMWGLQMGMNFNHARTLSKILQVETFNSIKKRAGVAVRDLQSGTVRVHWKGAAEIVLENCDSMLAADESAQPLMASKRRELINTIEGMAAQSLRCIAFGFKEVPVEEVPSGEQLDVWKIPDGPLTLLAMVGIKDPCRPGVQEAVQKCQAAGIKVRMLTGDNIVTAKAIAVECGILVQGGIAIEGSTFRNYSDAMRRAELPNISVMARSSPTDKLLMIRTLKQMKEVVAVTGDGTNDAPALHEADIGLAMGIQGTEVAKESSDIIILDDNFETVVKVVRWGRSIYVNIQKFIQFQLTVNAAALTINFVAAVSSGDVPLTAVQLLWVNLIMDTLGALALATEPPTDELLERLPVGRKEPLITNIMVRNLLLQAAYQILVLLTLQFRGKRLLGLEGRPNATDINNTVIFNAFVLCQLFNEVNARKPETLNIFQGLFQHRLFLGIVCSTLVLQVIIVEFLNRFASTVKLSWKYWALCIVIGFLSWPIAFVGKFISVPKEPYLRLELRPWRSNKSVQDERGEGLE
ncbi:hypothetical protein GOP47_0012358 [Adiantum capillus-veneris]|uniref:Calcium-transporting ATPase n=1 Tax=Adiantum capillus-veneris TaxID=13818 RepID=A0A9D4URK7_ADICA|nr:hypothetical protein GOP47_0012358 [Adiantum capillus-veneris]